MRNIKLTIEYDGTHFNGWQVQDRKKRTIQGEIEKVLLKIFEKKCSLIGSGRTDSGVHAKAQVANFKTSSNMTTEQIQKALNACLPEDVSVIKTQEVPLNFHSQFNAKSKIYRYTVLNRRSRCALVRYFSFFYPFDLNLSLMRGESRALLGRRDFKSFQATDPETLVQNELKNKSSVRVLKSVKIHKQKDFIYIDLEANGFLYKMVRNIVGTLLEVGSGRRAKGCIAEILGKKNRQYAGKTAPAHGLCLGEVKY